MIAFHLQIHRLRARGLWLVWGQHRSSSMLRRFTGFQLNINWPIASPKSTRASGPKCWSGCPRQSSNWEMISRRKIPQWDFCMRFIVSCQVDRSSSSCCRHLRFWASITDRKKGITNCGVIPLIHFGPLFHCTGFPSEMRAHTHKNASAPSVRADLVLLYIYIYDYVHAHMHANVDKVTYTSIYLSCRRYITYEPFYTDSTPYSHALQIQQTTATRSKG